jgi:hypothetical protein
MATLVHGEYKRRCSLLEILSVRVLLERTGYSIGSNYSIMGAEIKNCHIIFGQIATLSLIVPNWYSWRLVSSWYSSWLEIAEVGRDRGGPRYRIKPLVWLVLCVYDWCWLGSPTYSIIHHTSPQRVWPLSIYIQILETLFSISFAPCF